MPNNAPNYSDRTIFDFRSRLTGGGARSNLFECEINFPSFLTEAGDSQGNSNNLALDSRFLIKTAQLPGSTINTIPVSFRGRTLKIAGDRTFEPWTITVLNDTNFVLRNAFEKWSNYINRHDDNSGFITPDSYQTEIYVHQLGRGKDTKDKNTQTAPSDSQGGSTAIEILKSYALYGCYPSSIDPIPLSYDSSDSIEEFNVTFEVQWWDALKGGGSKTSIFTQSNTTEGENVNQVSQILGI